MINISTEFTDYGYTFNRSLSSVIELPYTKDEVLLGVNELVNGYNFNSSINKLQSNLMYLYSVSKIAQPSLPKLYEGFIGKATYATQKTEIILKNLTPYSLAVTAHANENLDQMPYFYVEDENNKTYTVAYDYYGINPSAETRRGDLITIDLTKGEYGGDFLAVYATQQALSAYFQVNSYRWNDVYGGLNAWPAFELSTFAPGGLFFGGQSFNTFGSLLATNPDAVKYQQGSENTNLFKLWPNGDTRNIQYVSGDPVESKYFNYLTSLSVEEGTLSGYKSFFCVSNKHISALSANTSSSLSADYTFVNITSSVGVNNELAFVGLNGSASSNSSLYVSDSATNGVYRINVNGFVKEDNIRSFPTPNFYETEIIGGLGGVRDNYSFNNPKILQFYKDELYVYDQGNYCIKVYDKDLGFVRNIRKSAFTKNNPPATVKLIDDKFYWLTTSGVFHILDNKLNPISQKQLYNFENSEVFIDFVVNESDNTMFVGTKQNIYKYFFNNINYIGRFDLSKSNIRNININFMTLLDVEGVSKLFVYVRKNEYGAILVFSEANGYENLLSNYNFDVYGVDEIKVEKNEFVSNFSYNKSIIKLLGNNLQLKNFITNVVTVSLLRDGGINYDGVSYFTEDDLTVLDYEPTLDNYIGTNEIFSRSVANRVLEKIYDYQLLLVSLFKNKVTPPPSQVNILSPTLDALMLEDFPGNANGYYRLETGTAIQASLEENPDLSAVFHGHDVTGGDVNPLENLVDNRDIILLENSVLKQVPIEDPGLNDCAEPPTIEEIVECDCFVTPFTTDCMYSEETCLPPYDLIDLDGMYTETIVTETNLCQPGWFEPRYETEGDTEGERSGSAATQYIIGWNRISETQLASTRFNHDSVREVTINDRKYKINLETVSGGVSTNYIRNPDDPMFDETLIDLNITPYGWGRFQTYVEGDTNGPDLGSMSMGTTWVKEAIYFNQEQVELAGKCQEDNSDGNDFEVSVQTPEGRQAALGVSGFTWTNPNKEENTVQRNTRDIIHKLDTSKQFGVLAYLSLNEDAVNYFGNVTSIGRKSFDTLNLNNQHRVDDTVFMMWKVPVPERFIGSWDYVGIDVTHFYYNVNHNCISAAQKDFFVYFDFFTKPGPNNITPPQLTKEQLLDQFMNPELTVNNTYELIFSNLNPSNETIEVSSNKKQIKLYDSGSDSLDTTFTINSGDATFSADGNFITGNSSVTIELEWDDSPSTSGKAVDSITINGVTWTQSQAKTGKEEKDVVLQAGYSVEGNVYDVNGCILYTLVKPNLEITKRIAEPEPEPKPGTDTPVVNKGQSGGIIKPGVILDPQDVKDLQEQLEHDPDFDLSVIGVQNADGDGFINPFTGQSASQGKGEKKPEPLKIKKPFTP